MVARDKRQEARVIALVEEMRRANCPDFSYSRCCYCPRGAGEPPSGNFRVPKSWRGKRMCGCRCGAGLRCSLPEGHLRSHVALVKDGRWVDIPPAGRIRKMKALASWYRAERV